jgi:membrane fusion protein (multidrug efflux system)
MVKRMLIMLIGVGLLFGGIFAYKAFVSYKMKKSMSAAQALPAVTVSAIKVEYVPWQPQLKAIGSLRAVRGVDVTSEIAGLVQTIHFKSGDKVAAGQLLMQLNADSDMALLHSLEAAADLADTVFERDKKQYEVQAVSKATLDADAADLKVKRAQVRQQAAIVDKKSIRAPFAGRLGISTVNPGQYINPGDKVVTLQSLDQIYTDFYLPQQELSRISLGQPIVVTADTYPGRTFRGKVTAVNPKVDPDTRNFQVEATIANPRHELLPGMYVSVEVKAGAVQSYLTLPQTAVTFSPYGETVFIVEESGKGPDGKSLLIVRQTFVTVGPTRGDQIAILKGINENDTVVTSGQLKLKNGSRVIINNQVQPSNEAAPMPPDE